MGTLIDLTGKKFRRLTVIRRSIDDKWRQSRQARWLCRCECGKEKIINGSSLREGYTKSCGCLNKELAGSRKRLLSGLSNMRNLISAYKIGATKRGLEYNLTEEQFAELTKKNCYYCGKKPSNIYNRKGQNGAYIYNGIDRVNNDKGYTIENTVPCCHICNGAKGKLTFQEFEDWIKKVYNKMYGLVKPAPTLN